MSSTADDKAQERREQIIRAATAVFAAKGFHQASMNDIVRASGMSKGGVYWHFDSKDTLIMAVLDRFFTREMSALQEMLTTDIPVTDRIYHLLHHAINDLSEMADLLPVTHDFYALAAREGPVRDFVQNYFHQYTTLLAGLIEQGVAAGEFKPVDIAATAVAIAAQFEGLILLWSIDGQHFDLHSYFNHAFRLLMQGLQQ